MGNESRTVGQVASLVRSKNAGPFWLTIDVFCDTDATYDAIARIGTITPASVAALYRVPVDEVRIFRIPELRVVKVSFPRPVPQGSPFDRDMHAGQQHVPMLALPLAAAASSPQLAAAD
jgi:hypothetical protein